MEPVMIIAVMGLTGAWKSTFINHFTHSSDVRMGNVPVSATNKVTEYDVQIGGKHVLLADTPGFDDSARSNHIDFDYLLTWLQRTYPKLVGVIYIHPILHSGRYGTAVSNWKKFHQLIGPSLSRGVTLGTTQWHETATQTHERTALMSHGPTQVWESGGACENDQSLEAHLKEWDMIRAQYSADMRRLMNTMAQKQTLELQVRSIELIESLRTWCTTKGRSPQLEDREKARIVGPELVPVGNPRMKRREWTAISHTWLENYNADRSKSMFDDWKGPKPRPQTMSPDDDDDDDDTIGFHRAPCHRESGASKGKPSQRHKARKYVALSKWIIDGTDLKVGANHDLKLSSRNPSDASQIINLWRAVIARTCEQTPSFSCGGGVANSSEALSFTTRGHQTRPISATTPVRLIY